jgi:hypothetical protein
LLKSEVKFLFCTKIMSKSKKFHFQCEFDGEDKERLRLLGLVLG